MRERHRSRVQHRSSGWRYYSHKEKFNIHKLSYIKGCCVKSGNRLFGKVTGVLENQVELSGQVMAEVSEIEVGCFTKF